MLLFFLPPPIFNAWAGGQICAGDTLFLFADFIPGVTYSWSGEMDLIQTSKTLLS